MLKNYSSENWVCLDFETDTSHGDYGHPVHPDNGLVLACWTLGRDHPFAKAWGMEGYIGADWGDEYRQGTLLKLIEDADFLVAHNAKYELGWLRRCGLPLYGVEVFDTKIAEYVLMGNLAAGDERGNIPRSTSLNDCCKRRGWAAKDPVVDIMIGHGINPVRIPRPWLQGRCMYDVRQTARLFKHQLAALRRTNREAVQLTRCSITPLLAEMEFAGMALDSSRVAETHKEYTERLAALEVEFDEFTGGINWRSPKQIAELLYNPVKPVVLTDDETGEPILDDEGEFQYTTPGLGFQEVRDWRGNPVRTGKSKAKATGKKVLGDNFENLKVTNKRQERFIGLRTELGKVGNALSKNLEFFLGVVTEMGGVFHAVFNQTVTATHRLSSSGIRTLFAAFDKEKSVQFQNLPNAFKPLFTARRKGWSLCEADGSQLEFRTAAQLSRDEQMVADIHDPNFDAHITSASEMHQIPYEDLLHWYRTKDHPDHKRAYTLRRLAKPDTFGPLYGKSTGGPEIMRWITAFRERYSGFYDWSEDNVHTVLEDKMLVTPWGMRYYWPYASMSRRTGYINVTTMVYNYPVQAFATAEIIPIAIRAFWDRVQAEGAQSVILPINTVHDSIICEVEDSAIDLWKEIATAAFTLDTYAYLEQYYGYEFNLVPLGVGLSWGSHWADAENFEEEWNVYRDGKRERMN